MPIPEGKHDDWFWPLSLIPRSWNAIASDVPPVKIAGTASGHLDVPGPSEWAIAGYQRVPIPVHFALRTQGDWLFAIGLARYTYPDPEGGGGYYTFPRFTVKRLGGEK